MIQPRTIHLLILLQLISAPLLGVRAIFIKPVSNLCSEQLSAYGLDNLEYYYEHQPLSGDTSKFDCLRTAQALFNESCEVTVRDKKTHEVGVQFSHFLVDQQGELKPVTFWTLESNLLIIDGEQHEQFYKKFYQLIFPQAVSHTDLQSLRNCNYVILIAPFFDAQSKKMYSAGTRFTRMRDSDTKDSFAVALFESEAGGIVKREIPRASAWTCDKCSDSCGTKERTDSLCENRNRRAAFVALLKEWCSGDEIIPYVWGGSSYVKKFEDKGLKKVKGTFHNKEINYWERPNITSPFFGFDCSGLVMRVAQICGIAYWFKTTATALRHGEVVKTYEDLSDGDLVVWNGHMIVVSDKDKNVLIESVGYGMGYGKLHEVPLAERFDNVKKYYDFFALKEKQAELILLYKSGLVAKKISEFQIISLMGKK